MRKWHVQGEEKQRERERERERERGKGKGIEEVGDGDASSLLKRE